MNKSDLIKTVKAAQNNDNKAIEKLFKEYNQQVYYSALLIVKNEELAKDITQETFITVIKKIRELEFPEAFPSWIKKVAHSKCSDYYKKKEVVHETTVSTDEDDEFDIFESIEEDDSEFIPDQSLDKEDLKRIILDILNELPDVQRSAIFMRYYEEMSVKEIAEIQGVSEGTVMSRLNYGRKAIAKAVEEYEKENEVKLHVFPFLPLFHWIFEGTKNQASAEIIEGIASGVSTATGVTISGTTAGGTAIVATTSVMVAKIGTIPLVAKIAIPAIVSVAILTPVIIKSTNSQPTNQTTTLPESVSFSRVAKIETSQEITTELTTEKVNENYETQQTIIVNQLTEKESESTTQSATVEKTTEEEINEDIYEIYEEGEEMIEEEEEIVTETDELPEVEMDGTTYPF